jgi:hypothetical protein
LVRAVELCWGFLSSSHGAAATHHNKGGIAVELQRKPVKSEADLPPKGKFAVHLNGRIDPDPDFLEDRLRIALFKHYDVPMDGVTLRGGMMIGEPIGELLAQLAKTDYRLSVVGPWPVAVVAGSGRPPEGMNSPPPSDRLDFHLEMRERRPA